MLALAKELLTWVMVLFLLGFLYFAFLRPVMRAILPPPPAPAVAAAPAPPPPPPPPAAPVEESTPAAESAEAAAAAAAAAAVETPPPPPEPVVEKAKPEEDVKVTLSAPPTADAYRANLERAREIARNEPRVVADLIRKWMGSAEEEAGDESS